MDPQVYRAAKHGDIKLLRRVVNEDPSRLLRLSPQGNTAIHVSVRFGHRELVMEVYAALLQHNSRLAGATEYTRSLSLLTEVNSVGDTPLHVAAREGHSSIAEFLIQKILPWLFVHGHYIEIDQNSSSVVSGRNREREVGREKIRMRNNSNNTAMHEAVRMNDLKMVKSLIKSDPDSWRPIFEAEADAEGGESLLYLAARDGCSDILNQIFLISPCPAHGGPHRRTALHVAALEEHLDAVKILLKKKGEILVNEVDENGRTPLHYAASRSCHRIVKQLLSHHTSTPSAYKLDKDGLSPLHIAAFESSNISVFRELIQWCPDSVELLDKKRRNVLHFALMSNDLKKIRFALKQPELKELINQPDDDGNTPFHLAARQGSLLVINWFHSYRRLDRRSTNNNGQTAADILDHWYLRRRGKLISLCLLDIFDHFQWLRYARRGEEKWMIGGANEEGIRNDPIRQAERTETGAAASENAILYNEKDMGSILLVVASLIISVNFVAVLQVPGGYNSNDGTPILVDNESFKSFLQHDAQAMFLSTSVMLAMFVASVFGKSAYSLTLRMSILLTMAALCHTITAFVMGLEAVLPPSKCPTLFSMFSNKDVYANVTLNVHCHKIFYGMMEPVLMIIEGGVIIALWGFSIIDYLYAKKFRGSHLKYK